MLTLSDGRNELWQWDTGRKLTVDADCSQIHFSNKVFGRSIDVDVVDGMAIIPDILLQTDKELTAWAFVGTPENGHTKISKSFKVNRRNKPADYVFTPPEQTTLAEIMERIDDLEAIQDPDAIKNAVDDYLANNPIKVEETDPTVPEWAKQQNPPDVKIPDKLPNPYSITFTGAVNASYDGSGPVEIKIPDSGGNIELIESFTLTEDTSSIIRDQGPDGTPYKFKTFFVEIQTITVMLEKWIQFCGYYDKNIFNNKNEIKYHKNVNINGNSLISVHTGLLEINGIIMHLASSGHILPEYHAGGRNQLSIAERIIYNINSAKIVKIQINSEIPLIAGTKILLYGVR